MSSYVLFRTNRPNLLGGFMTYDTLSEAVRSGAEHVWADVWQKTCLNPNYLAEKILSVKVYPRK